MKVRESDLPDMAVWEDFFEPSKVLSALGLDSTTKDVAEFGCGFGTFTIPAAKVISGNLFAIDIEKEMIEQAKDRANRENLHNIVFLLRDFVSEGSGLGPESVDYVMLFNILHDEKPERIIGEAYMILKPGGKVGIIHWNHDSYTPMGPPLAIRPRPEQCIAWAVSAGFSLQSRHDLKPHHYGLLFAKPREK